MADQTLDSLTVNTSREEEYLDAKRAAVEALEIGRETLAESSRQGEQLQNADKMADHTLFALDKSARVLRGMTWSGWFANLVSKDVKEEDYLNTPGKLPTESLLSYENVPEIGSRAAQAIQNLQANLLVLEACETDEQRITCAQVCDKNYTKAAQEVSQLHANGDDTSLALVKRFLIDLPTLRGRLKACKRRIQSAAKVEPFSIPLSTPLKKPAAQTPSPLAKDPILAQQDEHLEFMSQNLGELSDIAHSLHESFANQSKLVDSLDEKSDNVLDKTRMVTRRSDRLIQKKSWTPVKKNFHSYVAIRHIATGQYIAETNRSLRMAEKLGPQTCTFGLWKRHGEIFGLQNKLTGRWVGQSLVGSLSCSALKFSPREEWQADENWKETKLLCVSAGWGNGGYLILRNGSLSIGKSDATAKKQADLWCIEEVESNEL